MLQENDILPSFSFKATSNKEANFDDYRSKWLVLYFYPRDATPGCTTEGENFRDASSDFEDFNAIIFGISRDTLSCHERFKKKYNFPFELIDDSEEKLCELFGVMKQKNMYGKQVRGIERSTFIVDPEGRIKYVWRKVSVPGHVDEVLKVLHQLCV
jgi:peroxiredoxin Q/BCP